MAISKKLRFEVFKKDKFVCQYCGRTPPEVQLELDHIIPVSKNGKDEISNLLTSCFDCNRGKGNRDLGIRVVRPDIKKLNKEIKEQIKEMEIYYAGKSSLDSLKRAEFEHILKYWYKNVSGYMSKHQEISVKKFLKHFTTTDMEEAIDIATLKTRGWSNVFRYMCGILHNWRRDGRG